MFEQLLKNYCPLSIDLQGTYFFFIYIIMVFYIKYNLPFFISFFEIIYILLSQNSRIYNTLDQITHYNLCNVLIIFINYLIKLLSTGIASTYFFLFLYVQ